MLDGDNPAIKQEIIRMVAAYLEGEGYLSSAMTLMDEANVVRVPPKSLVISHGGVFACRKSALWAVSCGTAGPLIDSGRYFPSGCRESYSRCRILFPLFCDERLGGEKGRGGGGSARGSWDAL